MPRRLVVAFALALAVLAGCQRAPRTENDSTAAVDLNAATGLEPAASQVFTESVVDEKPEILSGPQLPYPDGLRQAGVQGRVVVQLILDTLGRAEPASVKVIQTPDAGFDLGAMDYVLHAVFRPARIHGRAVRVLLNIPIDFKIKR
jgi:protein TonB